MKTCKTCDKIGTQLDLIRDELMRIEARIRESKFSNDPHLSSILHYCERAQLEITVNYTPIMECDKLRGDLTRVNAGAVELREWIAGLDCIKDNPTKRLEWHGDVGWLRSGQCVYVGNQKPKGLQ